MVTMGITQAREMIGAIREAAADFIACADEFHNDPTMVAEYIAGIDDKISAYMRACCGVDDHL